jgi:DNA mismatch endonuclease (patch repair protein)
MSRFKTTPEITARMRRVLQSGTKPEQTLAALLRNLKFRAGIRSFDLPGKPDFIFASRKQVIFVHGCFWHRHKNCKRSTMPTRNVALWREKFRKTVRRDKRTIARLRRLGWNVLVVWECELTKSRLPILKRKLTRFLR